MPYIYRDECEIERTEHSAVVFDCDGNEMARFDDGWADSQIWHAIGLMNRAYDVGWECGQIDKIHEIKRAMTASGTGAAQK